MLNHLFQGIFSSNAVPVVSVGQFLLCVIVSLALGLALAFVYRYNSPASGSFLATLTLLPTIVCVLIMMVNGNVGTGIAAASAFTLVRFRSAPGTAREISAIFLAMGSGLIAGMGYLGYAVLFVILLGAMMTILNQFIFQGSKNSERNKLLTITIPEDLNYTEIFDDLFYKYTSAHKMLSVKTTNMGSMFKLQYTVTLTDPENEKKFIDQIRCRNGNLEVSMMRQDDSMYDL
ncbi:MAG: DUF4956 domain-containing protein [Lachnospiraceae bacterium]